MPPIPEFMCWGLPPWWLSFRAVLTEIAQKSSCHSRGTQMGLWKVDLKCAKGGDEIGLPLFSCETLELTLLLGPLTEAEGPSRLTDSNAVHRNEAGETVFRKACSFYAQSQPLHSSVRIVHLHNSTIVLNQGFHHGYLGNVLIQCHFFIAFFSFSLTWMMIRSCASSFSQTLNRQTTNIPPIHRNTFFVSLLLHIKIPTSFITVSF